MIENCVEKYRLFQSKIEENHAFGWKWANPLIHASQVGTHSKAWLPCLPLQILLLNLSVAKLWLWSKLKSISKKHLFRYIEKKNASVNYIGINYNICKQIIIRLNFF